MPYLNRRMVRRPDMTALEPEDPVVACECTKCRQDVYMGERTFEDGLGNKLCKECFEERIQQQMRDNLSLFAMELGYEVVWHV